MSDSQRTGKDEPLDDLDAEVVEDLDVDEDADEVGGGTLMGTVGCPSMGCLAGH